MPRSDPISIGVARERCDAWEEMHRAYFPDYDDRWDMVSNAVTGHLAETGPGRVLDLGCGPGTLTRRLAHRLAAAAPGRRRQVVGVDDDALLIALARAAPATRSADGDGQGTRFVHALIGDPDTAIALGETGPFDAIVSSAFMHYFDAAGLRALHAELRALVRPGGLLVTAERFLGAPNEAPAHTPGDPWVVWWSETRALFGIPAPPSGAAPAGSTSPPPLSLAAYLDAAADAGFAASAVRRLGASHVVALRCVSG